MGQLHDSESEALHGVDHALDTPNSMTATIHDRMPVILDPDA